MKSNFRLFSLLSAFAGMISSANALIPVQWPDCNCGPGTVKGLLAAYTFDNITPGFYASIPASYTSPLLTASNIVGPGPIHVGTPAGSTSGQWGCFSGFPANGNAGSINFKIEYTASQMAEFCGLSFNVFSEGLDGGAHGPTSFYLDIFANGTQVWESEWVPQFGTPLTPGFNNQIHFDLSNPDGNDLNGDGFSFTGNDFSWRQLTQGDSLQFSIRAVGANTSALGLDIDDIQVYGCVVPEPSGAILIGAVGLLVLVRRRRM